MSRKGGFNKHKEGLSFVDHVPKFLQGLEEDRPGQEAISPSDETRKRRHDVYSLDGDDNNLPNEGEEDEKKQAKYEEDDKKGEEEALERALKEEKDRKEYEQLLEEEKMSEMNDDERKLYLIKQKMKKLNEDEKKLKALKRSEQVRERPRDVTIDRSKVHFTLQPPKTSVPSATAASNARPPKAKKAKVNKNLLSFDDEDE